MFIDRHYNYVPSNNHHSRIVASPKCPFSTNDMEFADNLHTYFPYSYLAVPESYLTRNANVGTYAITRRQPVWNENRLQSVIGL